MSESTWRQAFDLLCNQQIGCGMSRQVFDSRLLPDCVVKVENVAGHFQNVMEWETWQRVKSTPHARWFAACRWISNNGEILIMERTVPAARSEFPDKMPAYLCDFKRTNFGMTFCPAGRGGQRTGRLVCHDYGTNLLLEKGLTKRMRKVQWWNEGERQ